MEYIILSNTIKESVLKGHALLLENIGETILPIFDEVFFIKKDS